MGKQKMAYGTEKMEKENQVKFKTEPGKSTKV